MNDKPIQKASLRRRLEEAESADPALPVAGESLYTVFQGASVLAGSLEPLRGLQSRLAPWLVQRFFLENPWRFEDVVHLVTREYDSNFDIDQGPFNAYSTRIFDILEELMLIPFCGLPNLEGQTKANRGAPREKGD